MIQTLVKDEIAKPLEEKLELARQVIVKHLWEFKAEEMFVAWSGGKDSTLLLALVRQFEPNIPVVFNDTGIEFRETIEFVNYLRGEWNLNLIVTRPEITFWRVIERYGVPVTSRYSVKGKRTKAGIPKCCYYLKDKPVIKLIRERGFKAEFVGLTAWESRSRWIAAGRYGICHHAKSYNVCKVRPLLFFLPQEVWYLTKEWGIPVNKAYEKVPRVGCFCCPAHIGWEREVAFVNPKVYELIQRKRGGEYQLALWK